MEGKIQAMMRPKECENKGSVLTTFCIPTQSCVHENSDDVVLSVELRPRSFSNSYLGL